MPRYAKGGSWFAIQVEGNRLILRDAEGERIEELASEDEAEAEYDDRVFDALQDGYRLTEEEEDPKAALERAILANPDDVEAHLVYADLLMSADDPRGELIAIHAGLFQKPDDVELIARARRFRKEHSEHFYGDFEELIDLGLELNWKLGFIRAAKLKMQQRDWSEDESACSTEELAQLLSLFLAHPSARFLRELGIDYVWHAIEDEGVLDPIVRAIAETEGPWDALGSIELGPGRDSQSHVQIDNGDLLFHNLPALRALRLRCETLRLRELGEPAIERLALEWCLSPMVARAIAAARWPQLTELELSLDGPSSRPDHVAALIEQPAHFPRLTTLKLNRCGFSDQLVDHLIDAPAFTERLKVLDLSAGSLTDSATRGLIQAIANFPRLERLDVSGNRLTTDINYDLRKLSCKVVFGEQIEGEFYYDRFDGVQE